jgi:hypothetical protein
MNVLILIISLVFTSAIPNHTAVLIVTLMGTYYLGGMFLLGGIIRLIFLGTKLWEKHKHE